MLRDEYGHDVEETADGYDCPVPEHEPKTVIDIETAETVWERGCDG